MLIESKNIASAWEISINHLIKDGEWVPAERGNRTKELRNVLFCIKSPNSMPQISDKYMFSKDFLTEYSDNYFLSEKINNSVAERINRLGDIKLNQIDKVIEILSGHYYSRRAVVSPWIQNEDLFSNHPPCVVLLQFQNRNNLLEITAVLRSNDAWMAALPDLIAIHKVQTIVASRLKVGIGNLHMLSNSYHIYEMDILKAMNIFQI